MPAWKPRASASRRPAPLGLELEHLIVIVIVVARIFFFTKYADVDAIKGPLEDSPR